MSDQVGRGYVDTEMAVSKSVVRDALSKALSTCKRDDIGKGLLPTHCSLIWSTRWQWGSTDIW